MENHLYEVSVFHFIVYLTYPTHFHRLFKLTKLNYFAGRFGNKTIKFFFYSFHDHTINATKDEIRHLNKQDFSSFTVKCTQHC